MANRLRGLEIAKPPSSTAAPNDPIGHVDGPSWPSTLATRPLSDIRELTEPSLVDMLGRRSNGHTRQKHSLSHSNSMKRNGSIQRTGSSKLRDAGSNHIPTYAKLPEGTAPSSSSYSTTPEQSSFYTIPQSSIPRRSSSQTHTRKPSATHSRKPSIRVIPPPPPIPPDGPTIPNRGKGWSPVKEAGLRFDAVTGDGGRRVPSRTLIRNPHPIEILESRNFPHHRVKVELQVTAPLFAGGGTVEGSVKIVVDGNKSIKHKEMLRICGVSIDLLGYEEVRGRRAAFRSLGGELVDANHPPPANMIETASAFIPGDRSWKLVSSASALPFMISLPLDTGPPPFQSPKASICFLLSATALVRVDNKPYRPVRSSQEIQILPTYDPEKALTSLSSPLTVSDEYILPRSDGRERITITAGLHRQVWVSGSSIFVDVHISNKSRRTVKRLDLELERNILCYKHAAAMTREKSAGQARIFEENHRAMVTMNNLRSGSSAWNGVEPHSSETRTCDLELPRGHATVRCGKYFEVRFFLNVTASLSNTKLVSVQLPIILIHMNSLDVVPNSVAQVAAAIEEKRAHHRRRSSEAKSGSQAPFRQRSVSSPARAKDLRRKPSYAQGRAFTAPREQSLDRQRAERADIHDLSNALDSSPRKHGAQLHGITIKKLGSAISFGNLSLGEKSTPVNTAFKGMTYSTPTPKRENESSSASRSDSLRDRLKAMRSFDTFHHRPAPSPAPAPAPAPVPSRPIPIGHYHYLENIRPPPPPLIAPHTLGLTTVPHERIPAEEPFPRSATASSFREKLDRSRFEFKAVRRKASGGLKDRGIGLWDSIRHKDREREDWI